MKLRKFDRTNTVTTKPVTGPGLSYTKSGGWSMNQALQEALGVVAGDHVVLLQDEDEPLEWYVGTDPNGFELRAPSSGTALKFSSAECRRRFMDAWEAGKEQPAPEAGRMLVGDVAVKHEGATLLPIISSSLKGRGKRK